MLAEELNKHRHRQTQYITTTRCSSDCISPMWARNSGRASGLTASQVKWRNRAAGHIESFLLCLFVIDIFIFFVKRRCTKKWEIATEIMTQEATGTGSGRSKWQFSFPRPGLQKWVRFQNPPLNGHRGCDNRHRRRRLTPRLTSVGNKVTISNIPDRRRW